MYSIQCTESLCAAGQAALLKLWNEEFIAGIAHPDMDSLQSYLSGLQRVRYLLLQDDRRIIAGIAFAFDREAARWFSIVLSESTRGKGFGRALMERLMAMEPELNGWVIDQNHFLKSNGATYVSPLAFYKRLGFVVKPDDRLDTEKIAAVRVRWEAGANHVE